MALMAATAVAAATAATITAATAKVTSTMASLVMECAVTAMVEDGTAMIEHAIARAAKKIEKDGKSARPAIAASGRTMKAIARRPRRLIDSNSSAMFRHGKEPLAKKRNRMPRISKVAI
jgi:hypothetical protein